MPFESTDAQSPGSNVSPSSSSPSKTSSPASSRKARRPSACFKQADIKRRASMEVGSTTLSAYMDKQTSGIIKRWQKRYFALEGDYLKYFESDKKITMKGAMDLDRLIACDVSESNECQFTLRMVVEDEGGQDGGEEDRAVVSYCLRADNASEAKRWKEALLQIKARIDRRKEQEQGVQAVQQTPVQASSNFTPDEAAVQEQQEQQEQQKQQKQQKQQEQQEQQEQQGNQGNQGKQESKLDEASAAGCAGESAAVAQPLSPQSQAKQTTKFNRSLSGSIVQFLDLTQLETADAEKEGAKVAADAIRKHDHSDSQTKQKEEKAAKVQMLVAQVKKLQTVNAALQQTPQPSSEKASTAMTKEEKMARIIELVAEVKGLHTKQKQLKLRR